MTARRSPVAGRSHLAGRALDVYEALLSLGCEVFDAEKARFVRARSRPNVWDSNFVSHVRADAPEETERLLARAKREYAEADKISFHCDYRTPPGFEAALALDGYARDDALLMLLEGEMQGQPAPADIRPVESDEDWQAYERLHLVDFAEYREKLSDKDMGWLAKEMMEARRAASPPARFWMAYAEGEPRAYMTSWEGTEGVGQVEDLFTHPEYRHRGLATALIRHCVADARAHGAGPVVIAADPTDTPKRMYAALGFRPLAMARSWRKEMETA